MNKNIYNTIDEYIISFPEQQQKQMQEIRACIHRAELGVEEKISYSMPCFRLHGYILVYFSCFKKHIGIYALPTSKEKFTKELSAYKQGKGSIQFPLHKPIPYKLIEKIVRFRAKENLEKWKEKNK